MTLTGTADSRGRATSWWFEHGTSTRYGARTSSRSAGSGVAVAVSAAITRLAPNTSTTTGSSPRNDAGTSRRRPHVHDDGRDPRRCGAPGRVRARHHALRTIPTRRGGETVTLFAQPFGGGSPARSRRCSPGRTGPALPGEAADPHFYSASWSGGQSLAVVVAVRPAVSLRRTATGRFHPCAGVRSFAGRGAAAPATATGRWITIKRLRLNGRSAALFRVAKAAARRLHRSRRDQRQPGRRRLPGGLQPHDRRPARLTQRSRLGAHRDARRTAGGARPPDRPRAALPAGEPVRAG